MKSKSHRRLNPEQIRRVNLALNFIDANLDSELSLTLISKFACYSPQHFHRIFKQMLSESLNSYIKRKRIEQIVLQLQRNKESLTKLSLRYGFSSLSVMSKAFRKFYGLSPREFRRQNPSPYSFISKIKSKNGQEKLIFHPDIHSNIKTNLEYLRMSHHIEVKTLARLKVAYLTHIGERDIDKSYEKLRLWAEKKELLNKEHNKFLTIYHDSFKTTEADKIRFSLCLTIDKDIETDGEIAMREIPETRCIVARHHITLDAFSSAWKELFIWMGQNAHKMSDLKPFEIYHNNFNENPEKKCLVDFCIPIR